MPVYGGKGRSGVSNGVPGAVAPPLLLPPLNKQHPPGHSRATPPLPPHPRLTRRRHHTLTTAASRAAPGLHPPPLGFTLHGVELRTCRARAPLSVLAPQHEHERVTSQTATRLWWAPVSVLRSWAPSRAVSRAVVHGLGTYVVHRL
ncbi:hypothetical protein PLESTM_001861200 [Pleodorina starrii]|nr:hypothetical protein PLESTM_001861200 [Pleodorina starrii]